MQLNESSCDKSLISYVGKIRRKRKDRKERESGEQSTEKKSLTRVVSNLSEL